MNTATITDPDVAVREPIAGSSLVSADEFARLVNRMVEREGTNPDLAAACVDQALAFVATLASRPSLHLGPSASVDKGWHELIQDTRLYAALCDRLGMFVHHVPDDASDHELMPGADTDDILSRTAHAIADAGYAVDPYMWGTAYAKRHGAYVPGCHPDLDSGSGCHCANAC